MGRGKGEMGIGNMRMKEKVRDWRLEL